MKSFSDIAQTKVEDVERPPLPPVGDYRWRVTRLPSNRKSQDEQWEFLTFPCKAIEAMDNVEIADYPGDIANITLDKQFVFNCNDEAEFDKTMFQVRQFLEKHLRVAEPGMSIAECLNASVNAEFIGAVAWSQDKRDETGETMQARLGRTAPVE